MTLWHKSGKSRDHQPIPLRHDFVVGPQRHSDLFGRAARLYYCVRCKWSFLVCGSKVAVLDEDQSPITGEESLRRFNTFAEGACPVLEAFVSAALARAESSRVSSQSKRSQPDGAASIHVPVRPRPPLRVLGGTHKSLGR
jgi:hypothetical protein